MALTNSSDLATLIKNRRHGGFASNTGLPWGSPSWSPSASPVSLFSDPRVPNSVYASPSPSGFPYNNSRCQGSRSRDPSRYYRENVDLIAQYAGVPSGTMNQMCDNLSSIARGSDPNTIANNKSNAAFKSWLEEVRCRYGA